MAHATPSYGAMDCMALRLPPRARWIGDSAWVIAANLSQAAGPFLGLILISRLQGVEAAGRFAYAQAFTTPLILLLSLQLKALLLTHSERELTLAAAAGMRTLSTALGLLSAVALLVLVSPLAALLMVARLADSWAELFQAQQQRDGRMWRAGTGAVARSLVFLAAIASTASAERGIAVYALFSLLLVVVFDVRSSRFRLSFNLIAWKIFFARGALLSIAMFLLAAQASVPRIALGHYVSDAALGGFATLSVILQTGNLVASSFGQALLPSLGQASLRRIATWVTIPAVVAAAVLILFRLAPDLPMVFLHVPVGIESRHTLNALCLSQLAVWPAAVIGYALTARRIYSQQIYLSAVLLAVAALASWLLIPRFGAPGAAAALGISSISMLSLSCYLLGRTPQSLEIQ